MNKKEFAIICMELTSCYPKMFPTTQSQEIWYRMLSDIPFKECEEIVVKWISNERYSPTISDIRSAYTDAKSDWGSGWEQVITAIRKHGMYDIEGALKSMDSITRECVRRLGFKEICMSDKLSVERANFRQIYQELSEREQKELNVPKLKSKEGMKLEDKA